MQKTLSLLLSTAALIALLTSCETGAQTGKPSKAATAGKKIVSNLTSVVSNSPADTRGIEKVARYKAQAEALAPGAPNTAQGSYSSLGAAIDAWVFAKSAEADRLASASFGQVDLSAASTSDVAEAFEEFKKAAELRGTRPESATAAILLGALADGLRKAAKEDRSASAASIQKTLSRLKLASWNSVRS